RGARVAAGGYMEGYREVAILDHGPHRIEYRKIVVRVPRVMRAEDRLARQSESAIAHRGDALDLGDRALEVAGCDRGHGHQPIAVFSVGFPDPVVVDAALGLREQRVGRRPHRESLVWEDDLDVHPVAIVIAKALLRGCAGFVAHQLLALKIAVQQARARPSLGDLPLHPVLIDFGPRKAVAVFLVDPLDPEIGGFVCVAIRRHPELLLWISLPPRSLPPPPPLPSSP